MPSLAMAAGTISGTGTDHAARHAYERAKLFLEALDSVLRNEHAAARSDLQRTDLQEALDKLILARAELERNPGAGPLAEALIAVLMNRARFDVDEVRRVRRGRILGRATTKKKRSDRARKRRAHIRRLAATMRSDLSASAKAKKLAVKFKLSVRTIRHILKNSWPRRNR
jgi:hypothetical protein